MWLDAPYVITARKLFNWAVEANDRGDVFPIHGTCLGFQMLHILVSNVSRNDLLVDTDSVAHLSTLEWTPEAKTGNMFGSLPVSQIYIQLKLKQPYLAFGVLPCKATSCFAGKQGPRCPGLLAPSGHPTKQRPACAIQYD